MVTTPWHQLVPLESNEAVKKWFQKIHKRELSDLRARQINSAAKQAREYFIGAERTNYFVRPLLTFYGINSLTRAFVLLMNKNGGEETLAPGHGITTNHWCKVMKKSDAIQGLEKLES